MKKVIFLTLTWLFFLSCDKISKHSNSSLIEEHTTIKDENNITNNDAYLTPKMNHGICQSPINIITNKSIEGHHKLILNFDDEIDVVENLGHTIQLDFVEGSTITVDDKTYEFKQVHFHTPSEHLINGLTFPLEAHIVNVLPNKLENEEPEYLVIAILFKIGDGNKFINEFIDIIPLDEHTKTAIEPKTIKLNDLFRGTMDKMLQKHYHYRGSLTTAPYTETVNWYVLKQIFEASSEQIEFLNRIEGNNARHIQATYGRLIDDE
jgi:carbonic anhydrase